jgi:hypothetical protein
MPGAVLDPEVHTHLGTYSQGLVPARGGSPADKEVGTARGFCSTSYLGKTLGITSALQSIKSFFSSSKPSTPMHAEDMSVRCIKVPPSAYLGG